MIVRSDKAIKFFSVILGMSKIRAVAFYPFIFISTATIVDDELINHEKIHLRQQIELLVIPFYIWYLIALYRKGYYNISFEREAYSNEKNLTYLKNRSIFAFMKYL